MASEDGQPLVVVGAGMTGMMAALLLRQHFPSRRIIIIDSATEPGGEYRCVDYGDGKLYDQGMRMLYDTGIAEFDALIHGLLPESQWHAFSGNSKDIAGIYWQGELQTHSPYIDLRRLPEKEFEQCRIELQERIETPDSPDTSNAKNYLISRFGSHIAALLADVLEKLYAKPAHELDIAALVQPVMNRVVMLDSQTLSKQLHSEALRALIAWPDQLTLPVSRPFNQNALYPRAYGMNNVINALHALLVREGVEFIFGDSVGTVERKEKSIRHVVTRKGLHIGEIKQLYWTAGLPALATLLKVTPPGLSLPRLPQALLVHILLPYPPRGMGALYHFYVFDRGLHTFRVTHYANYCEQSRQGSGYIICMELWHTQLDDIQAAQLACAELLAMGLVDHAQDAVVKGVTRTANLHAGCSLGIVAAMRALREAIVAESFENLSVLGVFAQENQILLYDVWRDMYRTIMQTL